MRMIQDMKSDFQKDFAQLKESVCQQNIRWNPPHPPTVPPLPHHWHHWLKPTTLRNFNSHTSHLNKDKQCLSGLRIFLNSSPKCSINIPCCILTMPLENPLHLRKPSQQGWQQLPNHGDLRILAKNYLTDAQILINMNYTPIRGDRGNRKGEEPYSTSTKAFPTPLNAHSMTLSVISNILCSRNYVHYCHQCLSSA